MIDEPNIDLKKSSLELGDICTVRNQEKIPPNQNSVWNLVWMCDKL